jgi:hypothetical protein
VLFVGVEAWITLTGFRPAVGDLSLSVLLSAIGVGTAVLLLAAFALGLPSTHAVEEGSSEAPIPND